MDKIGVIIPCRGKERKEFVEFCLDQISRQTLQPDEILVVDEEPKSNKPDITYRYRMGFKELAGRGCNLMIVVENDDAYSKEYIETIYNRWKLARRPELIGISHTIYYNIFTQKWVRLEHKGRSSMMSLAVTPAVNKIKWCPDEYSYTDMHLCKSLKGVYIDLEKPICVGIKHGIGLCGGGGHVTEWRNFDQQDIDYKYLSTLVDERALSFYKNMVGKSKYEYEEVSFKPNPFLSIVTRRMNGKRVDLFKNHEQSIQKLESLDYQQVFIIDNVGHGMLDANSSFQYVKDMIKGEFVFLLDDDDFITDKDFIGVLKNNSYCDVIFFKNKILTGDGDELYPKKESWETRQPKRGQIGGSCFVVRKWVYDKYIHNFAHPSFGDWNFITEVLKDESVKCKWVDRLMFETGKVSRGR